MTSIKRFGNKVLGVVIGIPVLALTLGAAPFVWLVTALTGRGSRRRHEEAWAPMRGRNQDGLTPFQVLCERRVIEAVGAVGGKLVDREVSRTTYGGVPIDETLSIKVPDYQIVKWSIDGTPLNVGIYPDGAGIWGPKLDDRFEEWDARTPQELVDIVCEYAVRRATDFQRRAV